MSLEELPQMDGTCDACEPDEAQLATQVCHTCGFAFCCLHADRHGSSTHHPLTPYIHEGTHSSGVNANRDSGFGSGTKEESLTGSLNEQDAGLAQATLVDKTGDDTNGRESTNPLGAEGSEDGQEDMTATEAVKKDAVSVVRLRCPEHGHEGSLYCKQDEKIICVICAMQGEHQAHEIITLHEAYIWQKSRHCFDLLDCTRHIEEKISNKKKNSEMSTMELEAYVSSQFDALRRAVSLEEKRTLHLLDLKEAFLTAAAAEKIAEINVQTERLQDEMASITHQLCLLDKATTMSPSLAVKAIVGASGLDHRLTRDFEARPRLPIPRADPVDPQNFEDSDSGPSMEHAP
ncbi:tripartite motif-containing protein 44 [Syngnathus typhle]|uniref:tripartite motif-containing protein 44 n=1 Tax=Syngnathus typhle TaxID=161592 RepID=UPI002A6997D2|nr:tripartite motif-containing protein 44 [Syngnathus typhle]XP_061139255.1 tripartite motif-containing protein 44 [Syngnathus typhle]